MYRHKPDLLFHQNWRLLLQSITSQHHNLKDLLHIVPQHRNVFQPKLQQMRILWFQLEERLYLVHNVVCLIVFYLFIWLLLIGPLDSCVGGSMCVDGMCLCPAGTRANELGRCESTSPVQFTTTPMTNTRGVAAGKFSSSAPMPRLPPRPQQPPRPSPAVVEVPLTPSANRVFATTMSSQPASEYDDSECREIGLICKGNTVCRNRSCQCPPGHVLLGDSCVTATSHEAAGEDTVSTRSGGHSYAQGKNSGFF